MFSALEVPTLDTVHPILVVIEEFKLKVQNAKMPEFPSKNQKSKFKNYLSKTNLSYKKSALKSEYL